MTESSFAAAARAASGVASTDRLTGQPEGRDPLFSGSGQSMPSVFNASHGAGDEITGIICDIPKDKQARFMDEDETGKPIMGKLKWWGEDNKPTDQPIGPSGQRKPVMDIVIPLQTDYRDRGEGDTGLRAWFVAGKPSLSAMQQALEDAGIVSRREMVGCRLIAKRTGKVARAWQYEAKLTK